jgi:DNA-binding YbaB/EbfC family protein
MFKNIGNIASMLNQARNIGGQMNEISEQLKSKTVVGEAGGSMVKVHANGLQQILSVEVDPLLHEKGDIEMLVDLLPAAINDAINKAKALHMEAMQDVAGGFDLPAGLGDSLKEMLGQSPGADSDNIEPKN